MSQLQWTRDGKYGWKAASVICYESGIKHEWRIYEDYGGYVVNSPINPHSTLRDAQEHCQTEERRLALEAPADCPACETGGKCPTVEPRSVRYCPQCGADLMRLLWAEIDRLNALAPMDQLALAVANAEHWRCRAESYESVIDNLREQRDWAGQVENLTDTALRERIQQLAEVADHFWQQRDSWMRQAEARTQAGAAGEDWNLKLLAANEKLHEVIRTLEGREFALEQQLDAVNKIDSEQVPDPFVRMSEFSQLRAEVEQLQHMIDLVEQLQHMVDLED